MRFSALLAALPVVLAAPAKPPQPGDIKDQWIVKLHDGASSEDLQSVIADAANTFGAEPMHVYVRFLCPCLNHLHLQDTHTLNRTTVTSRASVSVDLEGLLPH